MFLGEFPKCLLCLRLRDSVDKKRVTRTQDGLFCEGVPVLVGQRCLNQWVGKIQDGTDSSNEGDVFNTGSDSLSDDVERTLPGDLGTTGVS